jgi:GT2 family glycosyltransferase
MTESRVTLVVVPRERFSGSRDSLESIIRETDESFELVYVDGGSPTRIRRYLASQAAKAGFRLIRADRYLSPNEARNIGLREVRTEYVVFIDNDVVVAPGWLRKLVECADETGAAVVGPLTCIGKPEHEVIHLAGGEVEILETSDNGGSRAVKERMYFPGRRVESVRSELTRSQCRLAEFHCVLVRRSLLDEIGPFDEAMLNTREHLDFSLEVMKTGGTIYFEPDSLVTYVPGPPFKLTDIPYYMLRWSDAWEVKSLERFRDKWNLDEDDFFKARFARLGWRRHDSLVDPVVNRLTLRRGSDRFRKVARRADRVLNKRLSRRYERMRVKAS